MTVANEAAKTAKEEEALGGGAAVASEAGSSLQLAVSKGWQLAEPGTTTASSTQAKRALKKYCPARPRISGLLRSTPWAFAI